jgi:cysteine desulfurase
MPPTSSIYLDFNSTTPLLPEIAAAMAEANAAGYANPASQHAAGRKAHRVLEDTREAIAHLLGADITSPHTADRLIFCSGGTEANNLALLGLTGALTPHTLKSSGRIIISAIEHPSITSPASYLAKLGWQVDRLEVTSDGVIRIEHLDELLAAPSPHGLPKLVSVMHANNETGALQPIAEIVRRCAAYGIPVHTDAAQAIGKIPVNFRQLGVAAMTVAPHKFHGPRGIGALLVRSGTLIQPVLHGASQQLGVRAGTESVALPIGLLAAMKLCQRDVAARTQSLSQLRDRFEAGILAAYPAAKINAKQAPRLPNTTNIAFIGRDRQSLLMALDLAGIQCSTGSACASGSSEPSPTLLAMRLPNEFVTSSLRFSLGSTTTLAEIETATARIAEIVCPKK